MHALGLAWSLVAACKSCSNGGSNDARVSPGRRARGRPLWSGLLLPDPPPRPRMLCPLCSFAAASDWRGAGLMWARRGVCSRRTVLGTASFAAHCCVDVDRRGAGWDLGTCRGSGAAQGRWDRGRGMIRLPCPGLMTTGIRLQPLRLPPRPAGSARCTLFAMAHAWPCCGPPCTPPHPHDHMHASARTLARTPWTARVWLPACLPRMPRSCRRHPTPTHPTPRRTPPIT